MIFREIDSKTNWKKYHSNNWWLNIKQKVGVCIYYILLFMEPKTEEDTYNFFNVIDNFSNDSHFYLKSIAQQLYSC